GHARFLAIYLVSGISGVVLSYFFSRSLSAGAGGAIFGVAGALLLFYFFNRRVSAVSGKGQLGSILTVLVINAIYGVVQPGIDNWGHAGGLLAGLALGMWLAPRIVPVAGPQGETIAFRRQPSSLASWVSVPLVLMIL